MTLDELFDQFENLDEETFNQFVNAKLNAVMPVLNELSVDMNGEKIYGKTLLAYILTATIVTDYKLNDYEVNFLANILRRYVSPDYDYAAAKALILSSAKDIEGAKTLADFIVDTFGEADEQFKMDLVALCMAVAAVDGQITQSERDFLARLLA